MKGSCNPYGKPEIIFPLIDPCSAIGPRFLLIMAREAVLIRYSFRSRTILLWDHT